MDRHALFVAAVGTFLIVASLQARAEQKADWPTYGMDSLRSGYNPCEKILGAITVGRLSQTWGFDTGAFEVAKDPSIDPKNDGVQGQAILAHHVVLGGAHHDVLPVGDNNGYFYALDANSPDP